MKTCTKCRVVKPLDAFHRHATAPDGRQSHCQDCRRRHRAGYRADNAQAIAEQERAYKEANRKAIAAQDRAYREVNPHKGWESRYRRRARRFGFEPVVETFTRADVVACYGDQCAHCGGLFEELDHYPIPVNRGGHHTLKNCRPSCASCNDRSWKTAA